MITFIRYCRIKAKEIKLKLAFYSFLEKGIKEFSKNKETLQKKLIHEFAEILSRTDRDGTEIE